MIFKVDPLQTSKVMSSSRVKKTKSISSFGVKISNTNDATPFSESQATVSVGALTALQDLLNLQEISEDFLPLKRSPERGKRILAELEKLQGALLRGDLKGAKLYQLQKALSQQPLKADNPHLDDLVKEMEQRLAIEVAKVEKKNTF